MNSGCLAARWPSSAWPRFSFLFTAGAKPLANLLPRPPRCEMRWGGSHVQHRQDQPSRLPELHQWPMDERSEEHTSELQSHLNIVCRLLLEKKKQKKINKKEKDKSTYD